jgi:hypothetical protein
MIDVARLRTFDDVKQYSIKALWETYKALKPDTELSGFSGVKHAAAHILELTGGSPATVTAACALHEASADDMLADDDVFNIRVQLGHQDPHEFGAEDDDLDDDLEDDDEELEPGSMLDEFAGAVPPPGPALEAPEAPVEKRVSYQDGIIAMLTAHGRLPAETLASAIGTDRRHLASAVAVLRNRFRCARPRAIEYNRADDTYALKE